MEEREDESCGVPMKKQGKSSEDRRQLRRRGQVELRRQRREDRDAQRRFSPTSSLLSELFPQTEEDRRALCQSIEKGKCVLKVPGIIEGPVISALVTIVEYTPDDCLLAQALWAVGSIASLAGTCRDLLLKDKIGEVVHGLLRVRLEQNRQRRHDEVSRAMSSAVCQLVKEKIGSSGEEPNLAGAAMTAMNVKNQMEAIYQVLVYMLGASAAEPAAEDDNADVEVVRMNEQEFWALYRLTNIDQTYLCDWIWGEDRRYTLMMGWMQKKGAMYVHIIRPILLILSNMAHASTTAITRMIHHGVLERMHELLTHEDRMIQEEVCWVLSNILGGGSLEQVQAVYNGGFIPRLLEIIARLSVTTAEDVGARCIRKEALWAMTNIFCSGYKDLVLDVMMSCPGCVSVLVNAMDIDDQALLFQVLCSIEVVIEASDQLYSSAGSKQENWFRGMIEEEGGFRHLEMLQLLQPNQQIYLKACHLLDMYDDHDEDEG